ncbi:unnamed protein product, partial [Mesorhabditis belari]|uniref:Peptidase C2 calpain large subunit domain-containing protein n=1 Tax=Mesorhabditis belari TaxID=2138241 RepID=A0AAF3EDT2_9BILA
MFPLRAALDLSGQGVSACRESVCKVDFKNSSFEQLEVCNLSADVEDEIERMTGVVRDDGKETGSWQEDQCGGSWSSQANTAGGCINYISTFPKNPQFQLSLTNAKNGVEGEVEKAGTFKMD